MHHTTEEHIVNEGNRINWLRAAVLGANDGIVSVASVIVGVAAASDSTKIILTAGVASIVAGALSMAAGEYVSVSTQRDTEKALLEKERKELASMPEEELKELASIYEQKGLSKGTAQLVAQELTEHDAFMAHAEAELGIDPNALTNPWQAALASGAAFFSGAIIPLLIVAFAPEQTRILLTFISVGFALMITGALSAYAGGSNKTRAIVRVVLGGMFAMVVTYFIGKLFGIVGL